ncbi:ribosomal protein L7/L12 [Acetivibrio mesophilus]|nr:ribosomal protein L7/L12 [Acetivibrio mesophilus]ODM27057.1 hypothetical protein A7W90_13025 [Clostridium sp. Bc-iso-3]HHV28777.1 hypothetical protein [Clostridium sp.]
MKRNILIFLMVIILALLPTACNKKSSDGEVGNEMPTPTPTIAPTPTTVIDNTSLVSDDFFMEIEDTFSIIEGGMVVTGTIASGFVSKNAEIELLDIEKGTKTVTVGGIEQFRKLIETANAGDTVGILLGDLSREDVAAGQFLTAKGIMPPINQYTAKLMFSDEAFLKDKIIQGSCYFYETDSSAYIYLTSDVPDADGYVTAYIKMMHRFPMKKGSEFKVGESGNLIALGIVDELEPTDFNEVVENIAGSSTPENASNPTNQTAGLENYPPDTRVIVELTHCGSEKVKLIKKIREYTGLGLVEAKAIVDYAPSIITDNITKEKALALQSELREIGATVTIRVFEEE